MANVFVTNCNMVYKTASKMIQKMLLNCIELSISGETRLQTLVSLLVLMGLKCEFSNEHKKRVEAKVEVRAEKRQLVVKVLRRKLLKKDKSDYLLEEEILASQEKSEHCAKILEFLANRIGEFELPKQFRKQHQLLNVYEGIVCVNYRPVIDTELARRVMLGIHEKTHSAKAWMIQEATKFYEFVGWKKLAEEVLNGCMVCLRTKYVSHKKPTSWAPATYPRERGFFDLVYIEKKTVIVLVNSFSKFTMAEVLRNKEADTLIDFFEKIFKEYKSMYVVSDNEPALTSEKLEEFFNTQGVYHQTSVPYCPQSNGQVERRIGMIKKKTASNAELENYYEYLMKSQNGGKDTICKGEELKAYINFLRCSNMHLYDMPKHADFGSLAAIKITSDVAILHFLLKMDTIKSSGILQTNDNIKSIRRRIIEHIKKYNSMAAFPFENEFITNYQIQPISCADQKAKQFANTIKMCGFCHKPGTETLINGGFKLQLDVDLIPNFVRIAIETNTQIDKYGLLLGRQFKKQVVQITDLIYYKDEIVQFHPDIFKDTLTFIASKGLLPYGIIMANYSTVDDIKLSDFIYTQFVDVGFYMITCFINLGYVVVFHFPKVGEEMTNNFDYDMSLADYVKMHFQNCSHLEFSTHFQSKSITVDKLKEIV
uniref:Integrase catalytic domain-containing protein n=1 Tax=Rhabditophanes sp. KR3021 TaxID=114890 RepID=A0AC35TXC8_9BILA